MTIYAVDDEPLLLDKLTDAIREAQPDAEVHAFLRPTPLLAALEGGEKKPDVAFLDIELPGMGGLELARRIMHLSPQTNIVFVTGFSQYALEAYALHPSGYVMKPVSREKILTELQNLRHNAPAKPACRVCVRTFGNFEVYVDGAPLHFARSKAKEMFAYLIHKRGAACTVRELAAILFEDKPYNKPQSNYVQSILRAMVDAFAAVNAEDVIVRSWNSCMVDVNKVECDYYRFMALEPSAFSAYTGEYMAQYGWAEFTVAYLDAKLT